jgi:hypothetical protein
VSKRRRSTLPRLPSPRWCPNCRRERTWVAEMKLNRASPDFRCVLCNAPAWRQADKSYKFKEGAAIRKAG